MYRSVLALALLLALVGASGCLSSSDDGVECGDGALESGELCDPGLTSGPGACPTAASCDDGLDCTNDRIVGSPQTCDAVCTHQVTSACGVADGCCPTGCSWTEDPDCQCQPATCEILGAECGELADGCGGTISCGTCSGGLVCSGMICATSARKTGDACTGDADCDSNACIEQATDGWPSGYCSATCRSDSACGAGNHCGNEDPSGDGICLKGCSSITDCRSGYECFDGDGDGSKECRPVGSGSGAVGAPCASSADCAGGRGGLCATEAQGFESGYCTWTPCSASLLCPDRSHCGMENAGTGSCVADCTTDADCRADGYRCFDADGDNRKECWPAGTGSGAVGAPCTAQWECAGGAYGFCGAEPDWPGGYCLVECTPGSGTTCPSGSECVAFEGANPPQSYCVATCATASACRSAYQCLDQNASGQSECVPQ